jgi:hypothetical protein
MPRPPIKNKKKPVNLTIDGAILELAKQTANRDGVSLSSLVERMLDAHNKARREELGNCEAFFKRGAAFVLDLGTMVHKDKKNERKNQDN